MKADLFGIEFAAGSFEFVVQTVLNGRAGLVVTTNLDHLMRLRKDASFRQAYISADTRTIDGFPLVLLARIAGRKGFNRVPGSDLAAAILERLDPSLHRPLFVASDDITGSAAVRMLAANNFKPEDVCVVVPPFRFEKVPQLTESLRHTIRSFRPTHVFFAVGAPKSEIWCSSNRECFGSAAILCVGSGLNMAVGTLKRGPRWMRLAGFEWVWRMLQEPTRLGPRYWANATLLPYFMMTSLKIRLTRKTSVQSRNDVIPWNIAD